MQRKNLIGTASLILIGIVFGAVLVSGFGLVRPSLGNIKIGADRPPVEQLNADASAFNNAFVQVAEKVTPSIVQITVVTTVKNKVDLPEGFQQFFFPFKNEGPKEQEGGGSGIIISDDGYILTNNHVVSDAKHVTVTLHDKREFEATVVGTDPSTDLAVIKIDAKNLPAAYLGDSDNIKVGQWVMAIGNPLSLTSTVTAGIISATSRKIGLPQEDAKKAQYSVENFIQTDAVINPGNSGGALVDLTGAVVGINSAIATNGFSQTYIGYGFAIPVNLAKAVSKDLISTGKVERGYIGVQISEVTAAVAKAVGLDEPKGVLIQKITEDGAASKEDIKEGDIILKIDDKDMNEPNELQSFVASKRAGTVVHLLIYRDGGTIDRNVTLKALNETEAEKVAGSAGKFGKGTDLDAKEMKFDDLGMTVRNMNDSEREKYKIKSGVMVTSVTNYGRAFNQSISEGTVIISADKQPVNSVSDLKAMISKKKGKGVLLKAVDIQGNQKLIGLEIPK
jgi:serine protease Do